MQSGRRAFFKKLGSLLAGMTVAGRLRIEEDAKAQQYSNTYKANALTPSKDPVTMTGNYCISGVCDFDVYEESRRRVELGL